VRGRHREITTLTGVELHFILWLPPEVTGQGVLLVHGLASNARMWDGVGADLASRGHVAAAVDLRGHGCSSKPPSTLPYPDSAYSFEMMCLDLEAVISSLADAYPEQFARPVLAGQSYGANLVLEFAATRPWMVSGVACVDGGTIDLSAAFPDWESCAQALAPPRFDSVTPEQLESHARAAHPDWPESGIEGMLANFTVNAAGLVEPRLPFDRHMAILNHLWRHRPSEIYRSVKAPVLLIPAEGGFAGPSEAVETAAAALPLSRVHRLDGDHDLHAQHPEIVASLIDEILLVGEGR
jgi:pimeloyl-ACP methyl ester carboxylesterase